MDMSLRKEYFLVYAVVFEKEKERETNRRANIGIGFIIKE